MSTFVIVIIAVTFLTPLLIMALMFVLFKEVYDGIFGTVRGLLGQQPAAPTVAAPPPVPTDAEIAPDPPIQPLS